MKRPSRLEEHEMTIKAWNCLPRAGAMLIRSPQQTHTRGLLHMIWDYAMWSGKLSIERGIVRQKVDDLKTIYSGRKMSIDAGMLTVLKAWRQATQFSADEDWVFASPARIGRQPWSYDQVWRSFLIGAAAAGIGKLGTHTACDIRIGRGSTQQERRLRCSRN